MPRRLQQTSLATKYDATAGPAVKAVITMSQSGDRTLTASRSYASILAALRLEADSNTLFLSQPITKLASVLVMYKKAECGNSICEMGELVRCLLLVFFFVDCLASSLIN
jgi:hypothetical protein